MERPAQSASGDIPPDLMFTCTICSKSIAEVYEGSSMTDGLRDDNDPYSGRIPRMWFTSCNHLVCGEHILGGGVPFYPDPQRPHAPCPLCTRNGDRAMRTLYVVYGTTKAEHDSIIPENYFQVPPPQLSNLPGDMQYLKFQYEALRRFATSMTQKIKDAGKSRDENDRLTKQANLAISRLKRQKGLLEQKLKELHARYAIAAQRRAEMRHYLENANAMLDEILTMRGQLRVLGQPVSDAVYSLPPTPVQGSTPASYSSLQGESAISDDELSEAGVQQRRNAHNARISTGPVGFIGNFPPPNRTTGTATAPTSGRRALAPISNGQNPLNSANIRAGNNANRTQGQPRRDLRTTTRAPIPNGQNRINPTTNRNVRPTNPSPRQPSRDMMPPPMRTAHPTPFTTPASPRNPQLRHPRPTSQARVQWTSFMESEVMEKAPNYYSFPPFSRPNSRASSSASQRGTRSWQL